MDPEFWHHRWDVGRTEFNQASANGQLMELWPDLGVPAGSDVFVPLCGKSVDMAWLAGLGHRVVGCELSELAVTAFFADRSLEPRIRTDSDSGATVYTTDRYELWCGDYFKLPADALADVAAVYDRASLVALPPGLRADYAEHMITILPDAVTVLLVAFDYDQSEMDGPPFSVTTEEVVELYGDRFEVEPRARRDVLGGNPRFVEKGLTRLEETATVLRRR